MVKILIADKLSQKAVEELQKVSDFEVVVKTGLNEEQLCNEIVPFHAIVVRSATKVTRKVIEAGSNLKIAVRAGIGLDNIDQAAAKEKGIAVKNTPAATSISVAELTIGLMFNLARKLPYAFASMKEHKWEKKVLEGDELYGKTAGVIGFGRIGQEVAKRELALGMKVLAYDIIKIQTDVAAEQVDFDTLLKNSDYISLHLPLTDSTRNLLSDKEFDKMKTGVRIVNVSRGGVVDEAALLRALNSGKVSAAAIDVFVKEPPEDFSLIDHPNVIATPHIGASAHEGQERAGFEVVKILKEFFLNQ
jgi:D-3-phosphoglycerate dehydrogenase